MRAGLTTLAGLLLIVLCGCGTTSLLYSVSNDPHETGRQWVWPYFLSDKPTVVIFWDTDTMQCLRDVAGLKTLQERESGVELVTVATGLTRFEIEKWLQKEGIHYPVLLDLDMDLAERLGVTKIPTFLYFDVDGDEIDRAYDIRVARKWFDSAKWLRQSGAMVE
jgi:hypothetical protein